VLSSFTGQTHGKNIRYGMEDACLKRILVCSSPKPHHFYRTSRMMEGSKATPKPIWGFIRYQAAKHIRDLLDPVKPEQVFPVFDLAGHWSNRAVKGLRSFTGLPCSWRWTMHFSSSQFTVHSVQLHQELKSAGKPLLHGVVTLSSFALGALGCVP